MRYIFILFAIIFSLSICFNYHIKKVYRNSKTALSLYSIDDAYFYLDSISNYYSKEIYLRFEGDKDGLYSISICYTDTYPESYQTDAIQNCEFSSLTLYAKQSTSSTSSTKYKYYYKFSTYNSYNELKSYVIVKYSASITLKYLFVTSDDKEIPDSNDGLKTPAIIGIVIGSVFGLAIIITSIVCCCMCMRRKTIQGTVGYAPPEPSVVITNPPQYPLIPPTANYPNYQVTQNPQGQVPMANNVY